MDSQFRTRLMTEIEPLRMIDRLRGTLTKEERRYLTTAAAVVPCTFSRYSFEIADEETREHVSGLMGRVMALITLSLQPYLEEGAAYWPDLRQAIETLEECADLIACTASPEIPEQALEEAWR